MLKVTTERLYILPLDDKDLEMGIQDYSNLEKNLGLKVTGKELNEREKNVYRIRWKGMKEELENYMWCTVWPIILKEENCIVGTIMIKGYPKEKGEVIIGYAMEEGYRRKGYMTEALKALIGWIFKNPRVKSIIADTLKSNVPSHGTLQKVGMIKHKEDEEWIWWRLEKNALQ